MPLLGEKRNSHFGKFWNHDIFYVSNLKYGSFEIFERWYLFSGVCHEKMVSLKYKHMF